MEKSITKTKEEAYVILLNDAYKDNLDHVLFILEKNNVNNVFEKEITICKDWIEKSKLVLFKINLISYLIKENSMKKF